MKGLSSCSLVQVQVDGRGPAHLWRPSQCPPPSGGRPGSWPSGWWGAMPAVPAVSPPTTARTNREGARAFCHTVPRTPGSASPPCWAPTLLWAPAPLPRPRPWTRLCRGAPRKPLRAFRPDDASFPCGASCLPRQGPGTGCLAFV